MMIGDFLQQTVTVFSMAASRTTPALTREIDWEATSRFVEEPILAALRNDAHFVQSLDLRSQCFYTNRILRLNRIPCVPYLLITRILQINKATIERHYTK
jgi:hypothetical protein